MRKVNFVDASFAGNRLDFPADLLHLVKRFMDVAELPLADKLREDKVEAAHYPANLLQALVIDNDHFPIFLRIDKVLKLYFRQIIDKEITPLSIQRKDMTATFREWIHEGDRLQKLYENKH